MFDIRNAKFNHVGTIDLEVNHPVFGWMPFTASPTDSAEHSREIHAQALTGTVAPYVAPSAAEARAGMQAVSRRQLRLALVRNGISVASVEAVIAGMPDGQEKEEAQIEWSDATMFERTHPTLLAVGAALGLSAEAIDAMWTQASAI